MKKTKNIKNISKNLFIIFVIFLSISAVFALFSQPLEEEKEITLGQLVNDIEQEKVKEIIVSGNTVSITYLDETKAKTRKETESALSETLVNYGLTQEQINKANIGIKEENGWAVWLGPISVLLLPLLFFLLFFWLIFRQAKTGAMQAFNFGKARARLFGAEGSPKEKITFRDVSQCQIYSYI